MVVRAVASTKVPEGINTAIADFEYTGLSSNLTSMMEAEEEVSCTYDNSCRSATRG